MNDLITLLFFYSIIIIALLFGFYYVYTERYQLTTKKQPEYMWKYTEEKKIRLKPDVLKQVAKEIKKFNKRIKN